jgi:hypothetical protein
VASALAAATRVAEATGRSSKPAVRRRRQDSPAAVRSVEG